MIRILLRAFHWSLNHYNDNHECGGLLTFCAECEAAFAFNTIKQNTHTSRANPATPKLQFDSLVDATKSQRIRAGLISGCTPNPEPFSYYKF